MEIFFLLLKSNDKIIGWLIFRKQFNTIYLKQDLPKDKNVYYKIRNTTGYNRYWRIHGFLPQL